MHLRVLPGVWNVYLLQYTYSPPSLWLQGYATSVSMLLTASVSPFIFGTESGVILFFAVCLVAIRCQT